MSMGCFSVGAQKAPGILSLGHNLTLFASSTILLPSCNWLGTFYNKSIAFLLKWGHSFPDLFQRGHSFDLNVLPSTTSLACVPEQIPFAVFSFKKPPFPLNKRGLNRIFALPPSFEFSGPKICLCCSFPMRTLLFKSCRSGHSRITRRSSSEDPILMVSQKSETWN